MYFDMEQLKPLNRYHLLTQSVIPRPIAWVLTDNGTGEGNDRYNLAPFSFFNVISATPPLLVLGINIKKAHHHEEKDTLLNLKERKQATIHLANAPLVDAMVDSSAEIPHGESELNRPKSTITLSSHKDFLPRITESPIAYFCELDHIHHVENGVTAVVFCRILETYIDDSVMENTGQEGEHIIINPLKVQPVTRLGLTHYHKVENIFDMERPE